MEVHTIIYRKIRLRSVLIFIAYDIYIWLRITKFSVLFSADTERPIHEVITKQALQNNASGKNYRKVIHQKKRIIEKSLT